MAQSWRRKWLSSWPRSTAITDKPADLLPPRPAVRWRYHGAHAAEFLGTLGTPAPGANPPQGAVIHLWLKARPKDRPKIEILDSEGKVIRTLGREPEPDATGTPRPAGEPAAAGAEEEPRAETPREEEGEGEDEERPRARPGPRRLPNRPGLHCILWDLQHEPSRPIPGALIYGDDPETGPLVLPGRYTLKLIVDGKEVRAPLEITPDPRVPVAASELADQLRLALAIRDDFNRLSDAVGRLRAIRKQLQDRNGLLKGNAPAQPLVKAATALVETLDVLEAKLHNPKAQVPSDIMAQRGGAQLYSQLGWLAAKVLEGDGPPTQGMRESAGRFHDELSRLLDSFQSLLEKDLAELNRRARTLELPHVIVPEPKKNP